MGGIQILVALTVIISYVQECHSTVFTVKNNCGFQIWPATLTFTGKKVLTGFELAPNASKAINVPAPWSGRVWARYGCSNNSGKFTCLSGDCNSGQVECDGAGGTPPTSLVEITLAGVNRKDFYDISLVRGFNLPVSVAAKSCPTISCPININRGCPNELAVKNSNGGIIGCKSACDAFGQPQYCCTGPFSAPRACKPTKYSEVFKRQCLQAISYLDDDTARALTCPTGTDYLVTFCP